MFKILITLLFSPIANSLNLVSFFPKIIKRIEKANNPEETKAIKDKAE